jgi:hypothetical protein
MNDDCFETSLEDIATALDARGYPFTVRVQPSPGASKITLVYVFGMEAVANDLAMIHSGRAGELQVSIASVWEARDRWRRNLQVHGGVREKAK